MPWIRANLVGQRFERLLVLAYAGKKGHKSLWRCQCDCGTCSLILGTRLTGGITRSCGCLRSELASKRAAEFCRTHRPGRTHGRRNTPEYVVWRGMMSRCENPHHPRYANYGGRGIQVCERWHDFSHFFADMGERPNSTLTLERLDTNGPYAKDNCVWATRKAQSRNMRISVKLTLNNVTRCAIDWADIVHIPYSTIMHRRAAGWSDERILTTPVIHKRRQKS